MRVPFQKAAFSALSTAAVLLAVSGGAFAQTFMISQIYGSGGNAGATYRNDFVELYNGTGTTINFATTNYTLQYTSNTGTSYSIATTLSSGTLAAKQFFLISLASGGSVGTTITADATGGTNISGTAGKLALVRGTTAITSGSSSSTLADFVGYGTSANDYEGTASAPGPTSTAAPTSSIIRDTNPNNNLPTDTNQNAADFSVVVANSTGPRNSSVFAMETPEPGTFILFALGAGPATGLVALRRRNKA